MFDSERVENSDFFGIKTILFWFSFFVFPESRSSKRYGPEWDESWRIPPGSSEAAGVLNRFEGEREIVRQ